MAWPSTSRGPDCRYLADWFNAWIALAPQVADLLDAEVELQHGSWIDGDRPGPYPIQLPDLGPDDQGHARNRIGVLGLFNSVFRTSGVMLVPARDQAGHITGVALRPADWETGTTPTGPPGPSRQLAPHPGVVVVSRPLPPPADGAGTAPAPAPVGAAATFVRRDDATRGSWRGTYGAEGFLLAQGGPGGTTLASPAAVITAAGAGDAVWAPATDDVRAAQKPDPAAGRIAACWYTYDTITIAVRPVDGRAHRLALYVLDWDTDVRGEEIGVVDATTGVPLDTRVVAGFREGAYLVWDVHGPVTFRVTSRVAGANAVVGGLFLDPVPPVPPLPDPVRAAVEAHVDDAVRRAARVGTPIVVAGLRAALLREASRAHARQSRPNSPPPVLPAPADPGPDAGRGPVEDAPCPADS